MVFQPKKHHVLWEFFFGQMCFMVVPLIYKSTVMEFTKISSAVHTKKEISSMEVEYLVLRRSVEKRGNQSDPINIKIGFHP